MILQILLWLRMIRRRKRRRKGGEEEEEEEGKEADGGYSFLGAKEGIELVFYYYYYYYYYYYLLLIDSLIGDVFFVSLTHFFFFFFLRKKTQSQVNLSVDLPLSLGESQEADFRDPKEVFFHLHLKKTLSF